jgi:hypothetical protein
LLDFGRTLWAIEIKLTSSPDPADLERLNTIADTIKTGRRFLFRVRATRRTVVNGWQACHNPGRSGAAGFLGRTAAAGSVNPKKKKQKEVTS